MKKLLIIYIFTGLMYEFLNAQTNIFIEIWSGIQANYPTKSTLAPSINRLRIGGNFSTKNKNLIFNLRFSISSGKGYFGSTSILTPANDVALDSPGKLSVDQAYFNYRSIIFIGLIDLFEFKNQTGFFYSSITGNENTGFFSTHFLHLLANNSTDRYYYSSIPAIVFCIPLNKYLTLHTGITFGLISKHLFLRNTLPLEAIINLKLFRISFNGGFADADSSGVHKISPSWGIIIEKTFAFIGLFFKYSKVEKDIKTFRTPDIEITDNYIVAKEFSPYREHLSTGLKIKLKNFSILAGYSKLKAFDKDFAEKNIECTILTKVFKIFKLGIDYQYIINPDGKDEFPYMWIAGIRIFYKKYF